MSISHLLLPCGNTAYALQAVQSQTTRTCRQKVRYLAEFISSFFPSPIIVAQSRTVQKSQTAVPPPHGSITICSVFTPPLPPRTSFFFPVIIFVFIDRLQVTTSDSQHQQCEYFHSSPLSSITASQALPMAKLAKLKDIELTAFPGEP